MKLTNVRDVLAVAETGSIRSASKKVGIAQPSMSRSIRDTENELGVPLFIRYGNGVELTDMGRLFVRRATAIQTELRHIVEEIEQAKGSYVGQISVAMSNAASIALIPQVVRKFQSQYPDVLVRITESLFRPIQADLVSGAIDFFVGPLYNPDFSSSQLSVEKLFDNERSIIARKGHPLANASTLEELRDAYWVRPTFSDQRDEADFETMFERAGLPSPKISIHTRFAMTTLLATAYSDMLTILPIQWMEFAPSDLLVPIQLSDPLPAASVYMVRRTDLPLTPMAERLSDMIRKAGFNYRPQNA